MDTLISWLNGSAGQDNKLQHMRRKASALRARAADITTEVENKELRPGKRRKREVDNWLTDVNDLENQLQHFEQQLKDFSAREPSCITQASKLTGKIAELMQQGSFPQGLTLYDHGSSSVALITTDVKVNDHKFEDNTRKVMSWLTEEDDDNNASIIIGVYGPGGVGKSMLLKEIHNELLEHFKYSRHIYWVSVLHGTTASMLQDKIAEAMGLSFLVDEKSQVKKAASLSYEMKRRKNSVLILDDMWESFPIEEVGIPVGENSCQLVLTTRSLDVCRRMKCREIVRVVPLPCEEAWKLFVKGLGKEVSSQVKEIARLVSAECAGLPLGLIVMAASMRGVHEIEEWCNTLEELRNSTQGQADIERDVFPVLKLSYERLKDPKLRQCFLLCTLYPKNSEIKRDELIVLLRSEGLLDGIQSWQKQLDKAHSMLNKLENVCLLEKCSFRCVKMHNLIREMALRITRVVPRFMIAAGVDLRCMPSGQKWTIDLDKVSLMQNSLSEIEAGIIVPFCPCLTTLLLQRNPFTKLPDSFFIRMKGLKVLNLSRTSKTRLPSSISELCNLRSLLLDFCTRLHLVPSLIKLTNLRELNFSFCWSMQNVPDGMERLASLRFLDLEGSKNLCRIFGGSLSMLSNIQCLKLDPDVQCITGDDLAKFGNLERLEGCRIFDVSSFNIYVKTQHFQQLNYYEFVVGRGEYKKIDNGAAQSITSKILFVCSSSFEGSEGELVILPDNIQNLQIHNCNFCLRSLVNTIPSLYTLTALTRILIRRCRAIEFIWLTTIYHAPTVHPLRCLKELILTDLQDFKGLVKEGDVLPEGAFSNLKILVIKFCPKIRKLFTPSLLIRCLDNLQELEVEGCEELEEIIAATDPDESESRKESMEVERNYVRQNNVTRLPNLTVLQLRCLPNLTTICEGMLLGNCSIEQVAVEYCAKVRSILTLSLPSPSHHLRNLKEVKVVGCKNLQEIVATPVVDSTVNDDINELPNLRTLVLDDLPSLTSFIPVNLPTCSFIEQITIHDCPMLRRLPLSIPIFSGEQPSPHPCFQEIQADREWWESLDWDDPRLKEVLQPFAKLADPDKSSFKFPKELDSLGSHMELQGKDSTAGVMNSTDISSCLTGLRLKDGIEDPDTPAKYKEINELQAKENEEQITDYFLEEKAYHKFLKEQPSYMSGLTAGLQSEGLSSEISVNFQQASKEQEASLYKEIVELKASNYELRAKIEYMEVEAKERENKLREELLQMLYSKLKLR